MYSDGEVFVEVFYASSMKFGYPVKILNEYLHKQRGCSMEATYSSIPTETRLVAERDKRGRSERMNRE